MISPRILNKLLDVNTLPLKPAARSIGSASLLASLAVCGLIPGAGATTLVSNTQFLPGDGAPGTPAGQQDWAQIAAGGPGYLTVWEDSRSVLTGNTNTAYNPLTGNEQDIYATRIDSEGNVLDTCPIVVANEGRNQGRPQVAWNGDSWLVVYESDRPDWYFFQDILARRVSTDGQVLDAEPIEIRLENNDPANDMGDDPSVVSDGTNWIVVWTDIEWQSNGVGWPNVSAMRIAPNGTRIDLTPKVLYQHPTYSFGPVTPDIAWNGEVFLLVWNRLGASYGMRFDANLDPIDAGPFPIGGGSYFLRVESNGSDFLVGSRDHRSVYRVQGDGTVLDPGGILLPVGGGWSERGPDIAWDGTDWIIGISGEGQSQGSAPDVWQVRMHTDGTFGTVERIDSDASEYQYKAAVASPGDGTAQFVWSSSGAAQWESIEGAALSGSGSTEPSELVSVGVGRQTFIRFGTDGTTCVAVYQSEGGSETRILAQRLDMNGQPIDAEPVVVGLVPGENRFPRPSVGWNGTHYLVTWTFSGAVYGRRLGSDLSFIDPDPVLLFSDAAGETGVAGLGSDFFVAYPHTFSGDQRSLRGVRISGSDLSLVGSAFVIGSNYSKNPIGRTIGDRAFIAWERQVNHDNDGSTIRAAWIEADGTLGATWVVSQSGDADYPDVAVGDDRMLITWHDDLTTTDAAVEGRILDLSGAFQSPEFVICDEEGEQFFAACGWSGSFFTVAWADMRGLGQVDQLRGDIYTSRVGIDATVLDPGGVQVTFGPLPEDLPAVGSGAELCVVAFSQLHGACGQPEVQRIGYVSVSELATTDVWGPELNSALRVGPVPFQDELRISWAGEVSTAGATNSSPTVAVFSATGQLVWKSELQGQDNELQWTGRMTNGAEAPAGAYFVKLTHGERVLGSARVVRVR